MKGIIKYVNDFEGTAADIALENKYTYVICGHIHTPEIKTMPNGMIYMNDGDWVESCSALVEHYDGRWEIIYWTKDKDDVVIDITKHKRDKS